MHKIGGVMFNTKPFNLTIVAICFGLLLLNANPLSAQSVKIGVKGGFSVPRLSNGDTEQSKGYKSRFAPAVGIFANKMFTSNAGLQIELLYVGQGGKRKGMQPINTQDIPGIQVPEGVVLYADFTNEAILNYLEIPILLKYDIHISDAFSLYLDGGPYYGFLLNAKSVSSGNSKIYIDKSKTMPIADQLGNPLPEMSFDNTRSIENDIRNHNFGATGGIALTYRTRVGEFILDARGSMGLVHIQEDVSNGKNNTGALVLTVGYTYYID